MSRRERVVFVGSTLGVLLLVAWVRLLPLSLANLDPSAAAQLRHRGADGAEHVYLGGYDGYAWLRFAGNELRTGSACDRVDAGICRDTFGNAPVGREELYPHSVHVAAIAAVQRVVRFFRPGYPLSSSAFFVPVLVGALGVLPAFAIGWRLGGLIGGLFAAVLIGLNPLFLKRSIGSDNDVWNIVLPLSMMAAAMAAIGARRWRERIACAVLAALFAGLHAATWRGWLFAYGVLAFGLLAHVVLVWARRRRKERETRVFELEPVRDALLVLLVVVVATGVFANFAGSPDSYSSLPGQMLTNVGGWLQPGPPAGEHGAPPWPDALATVSEMARPGLGGIADYMSGRVIFFFGWLGLWVLALPRDPWRWGHWVLLLVGGSLGLVLSAGTDPGRVGLFALALLPALAAAKLFPRAGGGTGDGDSGAALLVILWFGAGLCLAYSAVRYTMLLAPALGIACGAAAGRLYHQLCLIARARWQTSAWLSPILVLLLGALLVAPVQRGCEVARTYRPPMNDAWWDTLARIRRESPANAIVTTWWDYGYWAQYVARRRVTADGGSLLTHIPHWLGRALLTPRESESVGLLRMLDCASDATPDPEGMRSAYGTLTAHGLDGISAHALILALARLDRDGARSLLAHRGLDAAAQEEVLAATHCDPPPGYLVLTSDLEKIAAWRQLGAWDPGREYVTAVAAHRPEAEAVAAMKRRFGYAREDALPLYREAVQDLPPAEPRPIVGSERGYLHRGWLPCRLELGTFVCPIALPLDAAGTVLDDFAYSPNKPAEGRLRIRRPNESGAAPRRTMWPAEIVLADATGLKRFAPTAPVNHDLAVLLDAVENRILLGTPAALESTFTQLMLLDGRYAHEFKKIDERVGYKGERVVTWRIVWPSRRSSGGGAEGGPKREPNAKS